jgi:hypothetical protein
MQMCKTSRFSVKKFHQCTIPSGWLADHCELRNCSTCTNFNRTFAASNEFLCLSMNMLFSYVIIYNFLFELVRAMYIIDLIFSIALNIRKYACIDLEGLILFNQTKSLFVSNFDTLECIRV